MRGQSRAHGQGRSGQSTAEERVGEAAAGRVGGLPVGLQVVGQVLTGVLKLVLIQDHVKRFHEDALRLMDPLTAPQKLLHHESMGCSLGITVLHHEINRPPLLL